MRVLGAWLQNTAIYTYTCISEQRDSDYRRATSEPYLDLTLAAACNGLAGKEASSNANAAVKHPPPDAKKACIVQQIQGCKVRTTSLRFEDEFLSIWLLWFEGFQLGGAESSQVCICPQENCVALVCGGGFLSYWLDRL